MVFDFLKGFSRYQLKKQEQVESVEVSAGEKSPETVTVKPPSIAKKTEKRPMTAVVRP